MLTKRQNMLETIRGGNPDRYVNNYEALALVMGAPRAGDPYVLGGEFKNGWGVTIRWKADQPGPFPVHDEEHIVLKDITKWREQVKAPTVDFPEEDWKMAVESAAAIDRNEYFVTAMVAPGIFEAVHYLMSMEEALMAYYEEPEAMHELIDYIVDYEIAWAKQLIDHLHPDALFHHDDWGSHISSFLSPEMFEEFFVPAYKKVYGFYKENGVEIVVHHSDSFGANLVPSMIEMGIDVWQGCVSTNNVAGLIKKYGGKITFMGGMDNGKLDRPDWTPEAIAAEVEKVCKECGNKFFIPGLTMGGPSSTFPGVYDKVTEEINRMSREMF